MPEIDWAPMPEIEKLAILGLLPDPCILVDEDGDLGNPGALKERVHLFTFTYTSLLSEDAWFFRRALISGQQECISGRRRRSAGSRSPSSASLPESNHWVADYAYSPDRYSQEAKSLSSRSGKSR